ncbi:MAG: TonB-dependent receptor [Pyrinomonadaceae bacterium]
MGRAQIPYTGTVGVDTVPLYLDEIPRRAQTPPNSPAPQQGSQAAQGAGAGRTAAGTYEPYIVLVSDVRGQEGQKEKTGEARAKDGQGGDVQDGAQPTPAAKMTLQGRVTDSDKNPLIGADVSLYMFVANSGKGSSLALQKQARTGGGGEFELDVPTDPGETSYLFSITHAQFESYIVPLQQAKTDFPPCLVPAACGAIPLSREDELSEAEESLVTTEEAARRYIFTPDLLQRLPLPGFRSFDSFVLLVPGVLPPPETSGAGGLGLAPGFGSPGQFSINGLRSRENNFTFDGSDNNDEDVGTRRQGFVVLTPQPVESLQELQVITALRDARFGRNIGGEINALTKSGSNEYHGTAYGFFTSGRLNARDFFDRDAGGRPSALTLTRSSDNTPVLLDGRPLTVSNNAGGKDGLSRSQVGLMGGGPFPRLPSTFLFSSFEHLRQRGTRESHFAVPTVAQRGAFGTGETGFLTSGFNPSVVPLFPATTPGNAIFSLYPFPNDPGGPYGSNTYTTALPRDADAVRLTGKLNTQFGEPDPERGFKWWHLFWAAAGDTLAGRYNFTQEKSVIPVTGDAIYSAQRPRVRTQNVAFFLNRELSPRLFDSIRFSFGRTRLSFKEARDPALIPSTFFPDTPFLLNAPLLLNVSNPRTTAAGVLPPTSYVSASSAAGAALLNPIGYSGITTAEQLTGPLGQVVLPGFSPLGVDPTYFPQGRANNTIQIADTLTYTRVRHVFTFGFDVRKTQINSEVERGFRPRAVFNGLVTSLTAPNLEDITIPGGQPPPTNVFAPTTMAAMGAPTGLFQTLAYVPNASVGLRFTQANLFLQDEWHVNERLSLIAGVRYEINTVPDSVGGRLERAFDPAELKTNVEAAYTECLTVQKIERCDAFRAALLSAFPADFKVSFGSDRNDFNVRVGFAWDPLGDRKMVVRGGFGTYSGQFNGLILGQSSSVFPDFLPINTATLPVFNNLPNAPRRPAFLLNLANPLLRQLDSRLGVVAPGTLNTVPSNVNPISLLINRLAFLGLSGLSADSPHMGLDLVLPQRELVTPYSLQYGITFERQFGKNTLVSVAYVGTRGVKLVRVSTPDQGVNRSRFGTFTGREGAPDDVFTRIADGRQGNTIPTFPVFVGTLLPPPGQIVHDSLSVPRTFFESSASSTYHSLQVEVKKRYSDHFQFGTALTYSHSIDDASDYLDTAGAFALPQNSLNTSERGPSNFDIRLRSVSNFIADAPGGWQVAGILTLQGGQPFTVNSAFDVNADGNLTDRLNRTDGLVMGGSANVHLSLADGVNPFDLLAPPGSDGAVGRNTFRGPRLFNFDAAVTKQFSFGDGRTIQFRTEVFNLFNRAHFAIPDRILESPGFGRSVRTTVPSRTVQFAFKYLF